MFTPKINFVLTQDMKEKQPIQSQHVGIALKNNTLNLSSSKNKLVVSSDESEDDEPDYSQTTGHIDLARHVYKDDTKDNEDDNK